MRLVMKFGGISVANGERLKYVASLIKKYCDEGNEIVVVISALEGVTNKLMDFATKIIEEVETGRMKASEIADFTASLKKQHIDAANVIEDEKILENVKSEIEARIKELENILIGIYYLGELTSRSLDYILSFGERLSAPILTGMLRSMKIDALALTGGEAGIVTDSNFGEARPLEETYKRVRNRILPLIKIKKSLPVVTGYIAVNEKGAITTLGRGGSDYTASLIGVGIDADEIWLWKDVDGIMSTDPKLVPEARVLPVVSYLEAMELSFFGAKILHPKTIEPAIKKGIPVRVRNTFNPENKGTLIVKELKEVKDIAKAVTVIKNVALINITSASMAGTPGIAARVLTALARAAVNVVMISQGSSLANISILVEDKHLDRAIRAIREEFTDYVIRDIACNENVCAVALVGAGMIGTPGVAGRVFTAMGRNNINVVMISQGSSEANISFVINKDEAQKAVRALFEEFQLGVRK
jgi:aspartate kinase